MQLLVVISHQRIKLAIIVMHEAFDMSAAFGQLDGHLVHLQKAFISTSQICAKQLAVFSGGKERMTCQPDSGQCNRLTRLTDRCQPCRSTTCCSVSNFKGHVVF